MRVRIQFDGERIGDIFLKDDGVALGYDGDETVLRPLAKRYLQNLVDFWGNKEPTGKDVLAELVNRLQGRMAAVEVGDFPEEGDEEDAEAVENVFCATGAGGGVDPTCGKSGGTAGGGDPFKVAHLPADVQLTIRQTVTDVLGPHGLEHRLRHVGDDVDEHAAARGGSGSIRFGRHALEAKPATPEQRAESRASADQMIPAARARLEELQREYKKSRSPSVRQRLIGEIGAAERHLKKMQNSPDVEFVYQIADNPLRAIIAHEAGHEIANSLGIDFARSRREAIGRGTLNPDSHYKVSGYSADHVEEQFAEITAAVHSGLRGRVPTDLLRVYDDSIREAKEKLAAEGKRTIYD
jgi:hypothetical protein